MRNGQFWCPHTNSPCKQGLIPVPHGIETVVVWYQKDGKTSLNDSLLGFQFNYVDAGFATTQENCPIGILRAVLEGQFGHKSNFFKYLMNLHHNQHQIHQIFKKVLCPIFYFFQKKHHWRVVLRSSSIQFDPVLQQLWIQKHPFEGSWLSTDSKHHLGSSFFSFKNFSLKLMDFHFADGILGSLLNKRFFD